MQLTLQHKVVVTLALVISILVLSIDSTFGLLLPANPQFKARYAFSLYANNNNKNTMSTASNNNTDATQKLQIRDTDDHGAEKRYSGQVLRDLLPDAQPQEGSPANTFTKDELMTLQAAMMQTTSSSSSEPTSSNINNNQQQLDIAGWSGAVPNGDSSIIDWHKAPDFAHNNSATRAFRQSVRTGRFTGPTNGVCPGYLQCNLVVLPAGEFAMDFMIFCQRNPQACPLIEVCEYSSSSFTPIGVAPSADLRTDVPKYAIYRDGVLQEQVNDATNYWPEKAVAFLIGCSFTYDGALKEAGIPLKSADQGKNVPMYRTNLKCRPAGRLSGNIVVSMKPIPALQIAKHVQITSDYPHAHGGPLCVGTDGSVIGIDNLDEPDWGDAIDIASDEVPVFHACGVTPQDVLMQSKVPFAITHAAGHMFVTDLLATHKFV